MPEACSEKKTHRFYDQSASFQTRSMELAKQTSLCPELKPTNPSASQNCSKEVIPMIWLQKSR